MGFESVNEWFSVGHHTTLCPEMSLFERACEDAKLHHKGDLYGTHDYYEYHLQGVVDLIKAHEFTSRDKHNYAIIGILHDIHEDHNVSLEYLSNAYGSDVADAIDAISYRKGLETRDEYYERCKANPLARVVKKYDAMFNKGQCLLENNTKRAEYYSKVVDIMS